MGILRQPTIWTPGHNEDKPPQQALEGAWRPRGKAPLARPVGGHRSCKVDCERGGCCQSSVRDRGSQTLPSTSLRGYSRTRKSGYTDPRFRDSDTLSEEEKNRKKRSSCIWARRSCNLGGLRRSRRAGRSRASICAGDRTRGIANSSNCGEGAALRREVQRITPAAAPAIR